MIFLANENFPFPSIAILRNAGYKVISVTEHHPGISDEKVMELASKEKLIILTFDKDYGELIFLHSSHNPPAVVFFRHKGKNPAFAGTQLIRLIKEQKIELKKNFTVIEQDSVRQRKY